MVFLGAIGEHLHGFVKTEDNRSATQINRMNSLGSVGRNGQSNSSRIRVLIDQELDFQDVLLQEKIETLQSRLLVEVGNRARNRIFPRKFDTVIEHDKSTMLCQPAVVTMLFE